MLSITEIGLDFVILKNFSQIGFENLSNRTSNKQVKCKIYRELCFLWRGRRCAGGEGGITKNFDEEALCPR